MDNQDNSRPDKPCVVVAGASGFIGQALGNSLKDNFRTIGLSRRPLKPRWGYEAFRQVDFFSLRESEHALQGADYAVYLIHSMLPAARLVQGHFSDLDILCADNFARAAKLAGIRHVVFVGGLIPDEAALSAHLASRIEVEHALGSKGVPVTTLRAGMVVGSSGSSYQLLSRLVRRLPLMACPSWTRSRMQPVALDDVVCAVTQVLNTPPLESEVYDLGSPDVLTYQALMAATAKSLGLKRRFLPVPLLSPRLSRLWISLTTGAPKALVAPLIESLRHDMVTRSAHRLKLNSKEPTTVETMLDLAQKDQNLPTSTPRAFKKMVSPTGPDKVCSVQRMHLPKTKNADWATKLYMNWLGSLFKIIIEIKTIKPNSEYHLLLRATGHKLMGFKLISTRSNDARQVLMVTEGLLAKKSNKARLEFRQVLNSNVLIAAVHDFVPRLPWWLYRPTQGILHLWVMHRFRKYLQSQ